MTSPKQPVCAICGSIFSADATDTDTPGRASVCPPCAATPTVQGMPACVRQADVAGSADDVGVTLPLPPSPESATGLMHETAREREAASRDCPAGGAEGKYVAEGLIGRGGMGEIFLCVDRDTRRRIAMKRMLASTAAHADRRARFVEEAQVTAQLEHPNIVPVHELGRDSDGSIYFTMKLVRGRSLSEVLRDLRAGRDDLSLGSLLQVFLKICDGLAFAHSRGVVHRDLKPDNIMIGGFGEVLVMDWGLAKVLRQPRSEAPPVSIRGPNAGRGRAAEVITSARTDSRSALTMAGTTVGTPAYMAPEQAKGQMELVDQLSDVFSLGAILYEILTLEKPYQGDSVRAVLAEAAAARVRPPEQRAPHRAVPRELSAIVMKCMSADRGRRYASAQELSRDVSLYLEGRSVSAAPDTFAQAAIKLVKRNRATSAAISVAAVIVAVLAIAFVIRLDAARDRAVAGETQALANEAKAVAARKQQRETAVAASRSLAQLAVRAAEGGRFAEAEIRADTAVAILPDGAWGHYAQAMIAREKKDMDTAKGLLREALRAEPTHGPAAAVLSQILAAEGEADTAAKLLERAAAVSDWRSLAAAGGALMAASRYGEAQRVLARAVADARADPTATGETIGDVEYRLSESKVAPACAGFWESIRRLPPDQQRARIEAKWVEIQGLKGVVRDVVVADQAIVGMTLTHPELRWLHPLQGLPLKRLKLHLTQVRDLGPLKGMPLELLECSESPVRDLSPIRGVPLRRLALGTSTKVTDLTPLNVTQLRVLWCGGVDIDNLDALRGAPLESLTCRSAGIQDLSPVQGAPLRYLNCGGNRISDLAPLRDAPLEKLICDRTAVRDLSPLVGKSIRELQLHGCTDLLDLRPLAEMPLQRLSFTPATIKYGMDVLRNSEGLRHIALDGEHWLTATDFWKRFDAGDFR